MSNAGSGDFTLPFDMSSTVKEVEKQTKAAESASRGMTNLEQHIRVISAAKKRIQQQQFDDILKGAQATAGRAISQGRVRQASGGFVDPALGSGDEHWKALKQFDQHAQEAADDKKNNSLMTKFGKGLQEASNALSGFKAGLGIAAYALAVGGASSYMSKGAEISSKLGSIDLQAGRMHRHLGIQNSSDWVARSGDIDGAYGFLDTVLSLKTQQQITVRTDVIKSGINAIRNGEDPATVNTWLKTFQWDKITNSGTKKFFKGSAGDKEIRRRRAATQLLYNGWQGANDTQRDAGALDEAYDNQMTVDHPILSNIPGAKTLAKWLRGQRDSKSDVEGNDYGDVRMSGGGRQNSSSPVRQPVYDTQGGGRLHQAADALDRATQNLRGRPSWRVGNSPSSH